MKLLKHACLSVALLTLAACGQMGVPEVVQDEDIQPLSDISSTSFSTGSMTSAVTVDACTNGDASAPFSVSFTITGNQARTVSFDVDTTYVFNGTAWVGSNPATVTVGPRGPNDANTVKTVSGITLRNGANQQNASTTPIPSMLVTPYNLQTVSGTGANLNLKADGTGRARVLYNFTACAPTPPANTPPSISVPSNFSVEATGPSTSVDFSVTASDEEDGIISSNVVCKIGDNDVVSPVSLSVGAHTVSCTVRDSGGLSPVGGSKSFTITVTDTTAPLVSGMPDNQTLEATGPSGAVATWTAPTANDLVDGSVDVICDPASGSTFALGETTVNCTAEDTRGNSASQSFKVKVQDTTPPTISWNSAINNGDSFYFGSVPAASSCTASDLVAGIVACNVTGHSTAVGTHTLTATATDGINQASQTRSYTALNWTLKGFYSPVDMGGVINTVKGGSTVPLKFEIFAASELTNTSAISSFKTAVIGCSTLSNTVDEIEVTTTGGTSLRYDATAGQFIQNWQTPKAAGVCYRVTMTTQDGSTLAALFKTK